MPSAEETLLSCLESYLKREGLLQVVPASRRDRLFKPALKVPWLAYLWAVTALVLALDADMRWHVAVVRPLAILVVFTLATELTAALYEVRHGVSIRHELTAVFLLLVAPTMLSAAAAVELGSLPIFVGVMALFAGGFTGLLWIRHQGRRLYTVYSQIRLAAQMIVRSLKLATILMPLLLVFVLFSVFSQEIWLVLAQLQPHQVAGGLVLISVPALLYAWANFKVLVRELTPQMTVDELNGHLRQIPSIQEKLEDGFLSPEEVQRARQQLEWRDMDHLRRDVLPSIRRRLRLLLSLLVVCMTTVLSVGFASYFFALFYTLIPDAVAARWMEMPQNEWNAVVYELRWLEGLVSLDVQRVHLSEMRTAAALGVLLAILANVYALAEEGIRNSLLRWLTPQVGQWQAAGLFYRSVLPENIQVVQEPCVDAAGSSVRLLAVVPAHLEHDGVEAAVKALRDEFSEYRRVEVRVHPRACAPQSQCYVDYGTGWLMLDDQGRQEYHFTRLEGAQNPIWQQHFLGLELTEKGEPIPDEWFGDGERASRIGRAIWDADRGRPRPLLLHPFVRTTGNAIDIEVRLLKRLTRRKHYEELYDAFVASLSDADLAENELRIALLFRDGPESVGSYELNRSLGFRSVRDATGRVRYARDHMFATLLNRFNWN